MADWSPLSGVERKLDSGAVTSVFDAERRPTKVAAVALANKIARRTYFDSLIQSFSGTRSRPEQSMVPA